MVLPLLHRTAVGVAPAGSDTHGRSSAIWSRLLPAAGPPSDASPAGRLAHVGDPVGGVGAIDGDVMVMGRNLPGLLGLGRLTGRPTGRLAGRTAATGLMATCGVHAPTLTRGCNEVHRPRPVVPWPAAPRRATSWRGGRQVGVAAVPQPAPTPTWVAMLVDANYDGSDSRRRRRGRRPWIGSSATTATTATTATPRLKATDRRRSLMAAATDVFAESNYRATGVAAIAERAGVSEPILYRHFATKLELFCEILDRIGRRIVEIWAAAIVDEPDTLTALRRAGEVYFTNAREHPAEGAAAVPGTVGGGRTGSRRGVGGQPSPLRRVLRRPRAPRATRRFDQRRTRPAGGRLVAERRELSQPPCADSSTR